MIPAGTRSLVESTSVKGRGPKVLAYMSMFISMVAVWLLTRQPEGWFPSGNVFRNYYPNDQLSYAGFAANAQAGDLSLAEPFTGTGVSFYPSWWYRFQGLVGNVLGLDLGSTWNMLGTAVVLLTVLWIGLVAWKITGLWWSPLAIGLLIGIGPLAAVIDGSWSSPLGPQAILWGPYGAFYTLNGEVMGLCLGASAIALTIFSLGRVRASRPLRVSMLVASAFIIGLLANIHTYAFFLSIAVFIGFWGIYGLSRASTRTPLWWSLGILVFGLVGGSFLRGFVGELPVFALMMGAAIPGLLVLARKHAYVAIFMLLALGVGAAPQVLLTTWGIISGNEFLSYRVGQSSDLGVGVFDFLIIGSPILALFLFNVFALRHRAPLYLMAALYSWFIGFVLLTFNNVWGFGQEPYRFWIDGVFLGIAIMAITTPLAIRSLTKAPLNPLVTGFSAALALSLFAASLWNIGGFRLEVKNSGVIDLNSAQLTAVETLSQSIEGEAALFSSEPCIDPRLLKITTLKPVAFYNLGMAWPENRSEIDVVLENASAGILDVPALKSAGVTHLFTDSSCPTGWDLSGQLGVLNIGEAEYQTGSGSATVRLWELF
jgi:hypothetical protein